MTDLTKDTSPDGADSGRVEDSDSTLAKLLTGRAEYDFIGRSKTWLYISLAVIAVSVLALLIRGLNFSIEFTGGSSFVVTEATEDFDVADIEATLAEFGITESIVQLVSDGEGALVSTEALTEVDADEFAIADALEELSGGVVGDTETVGPRWGAAITEQAVRGLLVFVFLVVLYITFRFEWRMAVSAVATLGHDVIATIGLYALVGFAVSPSTVIAILTILGYSLYDTVVVFDRITEDATKLTSVSSTSYGQVANHGLNQVLVRSLSTSITSVLPVASLLLIGATLLGAETLSDLALALFIGMTVGTYSSIIVAAPLLVWLKEKDPKFAELKERANA